MPAPAGHHLGQEPQQPRGDTTPCLTSADRLHCPRRTSLRTLHWPWGWTPQLSPGRGTRTQMYPHCGSREQKEGRGLSKESLSSLWGPAPEACRPRRPVLPSAWGGGTATARPRGWCWVLLGQACWEAPGRGAAAGAVVGHHGDCPIKPALCRPELLSVCPRACPLPVWGWAGAALPRSPHSRPPLPPARPEHSLPRTCRAAGCHTALWTVPSEVWPWG